MKAGTLLNNYGEVLVILTRLRQLCCHPKLCTAALEAAAKEGIQTPFLSLPPPSPLEHLIIFCKGRPGKGQRNERKRESPSYVEFHCLAVNRLMRNHITF